MQRCSSSTSSARRICVAGVDPEVVRRRVGRFFDQVSHCVITHGGTVEKFAGDAVMAAFGVPLQHEDDAERAVRAALATLDRVGELGLEVRIGIESGEVVADETDSTFATGEAVNLAARLEQQAGPNEIVIGPTAARSSGISSSSRSSSRSSCVAGASRSRRAASSERAEPGRPMRSLSAPLVGRESELELLENTFARTARDGRATLVTLYGEPGVGKSRLAREFVDGLECATVLRGRCLPYGEGVTYWSIAEMVKASAGISDDDPLDEAFEKLRETCESEAVADLLGLAVGVLEAVEGERSQQDIAWAVRSWIEQLAAVQPLVLVFEDVHWAEEPLLEVIEHIAAWVRTAPVLLLCLARPELLDARPAWGGGRLRARHARARALCPTTRARSSCERSLQSSTSRSTSRRSWRRRRETRCSSRRPIRAARRAARRRCSSAFPTRCRLSSPRASTVCPPESRRLVQRASVMGRVFLRGALAHLSPDVGGRRRRPRRSALPGLRPARGSVGDQRRAGVQVQARPHPRGRLRGAVEGIARRSPPPLRRAGSASARARSSSRSSPSISTRRLGCSRSSTESAPPELAEEAAAELLRAGRRALSRESFPSARNLLIRAVELAPTLERRYYAARAAWRLGDMTAVIIEMEEVAAAADAAGERQLQGRALTALAEAVMNQRADAAAARELIEGPWRCWPTRSPICASKPSRSPLPSPAGSATPTRSRNGRSSLSRRRGRPTGRTRSSRSRWRSPRTTCIASSSPRPSPSIDRIGELADESGSIVGRALAWAARGTLENWRGNDAEAEVAFTAAHDLYAEIGNRAEEASMALSIARHAVALGDLARAEQLLLEAVRTMKGLMDRSRLCEAQRSLAELYVRLGRLEEAERYALEARESVGPDDRSSISTTKLSLGVVRAAQGRDEEAAELMHEAVDDARCTDQRAARTLGARQGDRLPPLPRAGRRGPRYEERLAELAPSSTSPIASRRRGVGRLADHGRRPLEARERVAQRLGAQRSLAVREMLRLVPVRVLDVAEVDVERRVGLEHGVGAGERVGEAHPASRNAPSLVACMCAKSSTGRTKSTCAAIASTSSIVPRSRTRPITSTPNGTSRPFASSRSRRSPSWSTTSAIACSRSRPSRKPGWKTISCAPHAWASPRCGRASRAPS